MPTMCRFDKHISLAILLCAIGLTGCGFLNGGAGNALATVTATHTPPTSTPEPLAASVNGEAIRLEDFEEEVLRYEAAQRDAGIDLATLGDYRNQVLQALIDRRVLAQGARANGDVIDESTINAKIQDLAAELGGNEAMGVWLAETGYTLDDFKAALEEDMLAAQMVEHIIQDVPLSVEQVHARHILVSTEEDARFILQQLDAGADFAELASRYSRDASTQAGGGDLGWFPRGQLLIQEVETVAFELQAGELSGVVQSVLGYHVVQTLELGDRSLSPNDLREMHNQAVKDWIAAQREIAIIEVFTAP